MTLDENGNVMPYVVFMTVAKRISVKLFVDEEEDEVLDPATLLSNNEIPSVTPLIDWGEENDPDVVGKPRVKNPPSGTILTQNTERFDQFYLVSQKTTKTCACPIRIRVLRNSASHRNGLRAASQASEDQPDLLTSHYLQSLSYKLCYLYFNTASICRQPAPGMVSCMFFLVSIL